MDAKKLKVAAEEIRKFGEMFGNVIAIGAEIESVLALEERVATAERTLSSTERRYEAILTIVDVEEAARLAGERIAGLAKQEQAAAALKESTEKSLAAAKGELKTVTADLVALTKQREDLRARIDKILRA
jgi:chromosome segregation ATPase